MHSYEAAITALLHVVLRLLLLGYGAGLRPQNAGS